jgi:hypothetical protein
VAGSLLLRILLRAAVLTLVGRDGRANELGVSYMGVVRRFTIRHSKLPRLEVLCLPPGRQKATACQN